MNAPDSNPLLKIALRSQILSQDEHGRNCWKVLKRTKTLSAAETALLLCDVWDKHWCRGACERLEAMIGRMSEVVKAARAKGVTVIHAPSDTMDFYANTPARQRVLAAPQVPPPTPLDRPDVPMPVDASDNGSDTGETSWHTAWKQQHPAIEIDQERDGISDKGPEVYSFMQQRGVKNLIIMGVHTNMCVLNRTFAIKQMVRWGMNVMLIRDLTDTMYNPAKPPYVSHDEGTRLVVEYIEKFWCPTLRSDDLLGD